MAEIERQNNIADDLQFDVAEPMNSAAAMATPTCAGCRRPIVDQYFALKQMMLCPDCRQHVDAPLPGNPSGRFFNALFLGAGAAIGGAVVWGLVSYYTHYQLGILAVAVGYFIGKTIRKGSGGRGGRAYQFLALVLTYLCICGSYIPDIVDAMAKSSHTRHAGTVELDVIRVIFAAIVSIAAPILAAFEAPIGVLIQGFALWEAWKFTKKIDLPITGPYQVGTGTAPPLPARPA